MLNISGQFFNTTTIPGEGNSQTVYFKEQDVNWFGNEKVSRLKDSGRELFETGTYSSDKLQNEAK